MPATWSATDKNAHVVLSNDSLTVATDGTPATHFAGRSAPAVVVSSGLKKHFEFTVNVLGSSHDLGVGVVNASETFADNEYIGGQANGYGYYDDGAIYFGGPQVDTLAGFTTSNVLGIDIDRVNDKVWFSVNGVYFGTNNPLTNTGGISIAGLGDVYPAYNVRGSGQGTANFGGTAFAFPTSGFTGFDISGVTLMGQVVMG